jgi:hypothetical protein
MVRGTVALSADRGFVLGSDDKKIWLIVRPAPMSKRDMPHNLIKVLEDNFVGGVHGLYKVCPIPTLPTQFPPEETHFACIDSASALSADRSSRSSK